MSGSIPKDHDLQLTGVPEGLDALVLAKLVQEARGADGRPGILIHVARDDRRVDQLERALKF